MEKQGQIFVTNLKKLQGQHFDFFPMISLYALDVICGKKKEKSSLKSSKLLQLKNVLRSSMFQNLRWVVK